MNRHMMTFLNEAYSSLILAGPLLIVAADPSVTSLAGALALTAGCVYQRSRVDVLEKRLAALEEKGSAAAGRT